MRALDVAMTEAACPDNLAILNHNGRQPGNASLLAQGFEVPLEQRKGKVLRARLVHDEQGGDPDSKDPDKPKHKDVVESAFYIGCKDMIGGRIDAGMLECERRA